jgi:predicted PurR-regulated permease PerM
VTDRSEGIVPKAADRAATSTHASVLTPDVDPTAAAAPAAPGAPTPDIERTADAATDHHRRPTAITILALLALLYTLYFARDFLIPIVYAILLNFLLSPAIRALARWRVPPSIGAAALVLALLAAIGGATYALAGPAQRWAANAPETLTRAETKLHHLIRPVQQVSSQVEQAAGAVGTTTGGKGPQQVVVAAGPSVSSRIFGTTEKLVAAILEIVILLYFLLAGGDLFLQKLIKVLPHFSDKLKAVEIARATEAAVSAFLTTALMVNVVEGTVVALALWGIGLPNAPLWGVIVALLEFVPYLGAAMAVVILGLAGLTTFDSVGHALLAPGAFLLINLIQANVVSPLLLGHRLTLNPVAIFVGLTFFFWIWGVPGAFLAVPVLATFKIFCDHIESLAAVGEFLGQRDENERRVVVRSARELQPRSVPRAKPL